MPPKSSQLQLQQLSYEQLRGFKESLDGDIQSLHRAHEGLRGARGRYLESRGCLENFKKYAQEQEIMVPMSGSLYLKGTLKDTESVLVDVGTGYFIKQSVPRAQDFFVSRAAQLKEAMDNIGEAMTAKQRTQNQVIDIMQQKAQAAQAAQQQSE